jgi:hypothetical protein
MQEELAGLKKPTSPRALEIMAAIKLVHLALVPAMVAISLLQLAAHKGASLASKTSKQQ